MITDWVRLDIEKRKCLSSRKKLIQRRRTIIRRFAERWCTIGNWNVTPAPCVNATRVPSFRVKTSGRIRTATNAIVWISFSFYLFLIFRFSWTHGSAGQKSPGVEVGSEVVRETTLYHDPIPVTISMKLNNNVVSSKEWTKRRWTTNSRRCWWVEVDFSIDDRYPDTRGGFRDDQVFAKNRPTWIWPRRRKSPWDSNRKQRRGRCWFCITKVAYRRIDQNLINQRITYSIWRNPIWASTKSTTASSR